MIVAEPVAKSITWNPISRDAGAKGTRAAERLAEKNGPVFADLSPSEFASWLMEPAMKVLGSSAGTPEAAVHGDTLFVRANVAITELGDPKQLGPLASMLDGRQPVVIGGRLEALHPGLLAFHVTSLSVKELKLPGKLIDRIVQRISVNARTDSMPAGAVALPVPRSIADVRVTKGHVVLYKAVP
jgi:hypothetical protein